MKLFIFFVIAFLAIVYVYSFLKIRKKRKNKTSAVKDFNNLYYDTLRNNKAPRDKNNINDLNYQKYKTKYNSSVDYISKDEL